MKTYGKLIGIVLVAGLAALVAPSAMAAPIVVNDLGETNCLDMSVLDNAMCATDPLAPLSDATALVAMNDLGNSIEIPWIGEDAWTDGWTMTPTKKMLLQPINVAGVLVQSCSDETIAAANIDIMMPLPEELIDTTATAATCMLDISGAGSGLSTTT